MGRRVVITGLGTVTSLGLEIDEFWNNIINGNSGISRITKFDVSNYSSKIGAEIKNYNPEEYIDARDVRKIGIFTQYAISAAFKAINDANLEINEKNDGRVGVLIGSGIGGNLLSSCKRGEIGRVIFVEISLA